MAVIEVRGLRKEYAGREAVRGIDLTVQTGEVFALLGPNGAGKTSTLEVLEGFRERSGGEVRVLGEDPARGGPALRSRIGIVLQETAVDPYLSVTEVLQRYAAYYPRPRPVDEVIELVGLTEKAGARVKTLSGGQQRRLDVALGIVGDPELLFLDEPTTGFDPTARRGAWDLVRRLTGRGTTIVLTTHYMDEAQALADRIAVLADGRIVAEGTPETLGGRDTGQAVIRFRSPGAPPPLPCTERDGWCEVTTDDEVRALHTLTGWALSGGLPLAALSVTRPTLEDVYLKLTAGPADQADAAADAVGASR